MSSLKKNVIYNLILQGSNVLFPVITFPYIARVLGPEGVGLANFAQNFCLYFVMIATLGIPIYGNREIAKSRDDIKKSSQIFFEINVIRTAMTLLVLVPYFIIIYTVNKFQNNLILYYWGAFYIVANITSLEWFFTGHEKFKYITLRSVFVKLLYVVSLFIFVKNSDDVIIYFVIIILSTLVNGLINTIFALNFIHLYVKWRDFEIRKHISPLFLLFGYFLATSMYTMVDTILLGLLSTNAAVGFYTSAIRLVKICLTLTTSMGDVLVPRLTSEVVKSNFQEVKRLLNQSLNFIFTFGISIMAGVFILAPELIIIFSGEEFIPAISTMRLLSVLVLVIGLANIFAVQILIPLAKDKLLLYGSLLGGGVSIGLNVVLIPLLQQNGAAVALIVAETVVMLFAFWFAKRSLDFTFSFRHLFLNLIAVAPYFLVAYAGRLLLDNHILIVLFTTFFSACVFLFLQVFIIRNQLIVNQLHTFKEKFLRH